MFEHDRLANRPPRDARGRDRTVWRADVLADSVIQVVPGEAGGGLAGGVPQLSESGIQIDVHLTADRRDELTEVEMTADVYEQVGRARDLEQFVPHGSVHLFARLINECRRVGQAELRRHLAEVAEVVAALERDRRAIRV